MITIGELIQRLSRLDPSLTVYHETETGPAYVTQVHPTPIVSISQGDSGDGVVLGSENTADDWRKWVEEQRRDHANYIRKYGVHVEGM